MKTARIAIGTAATAALLITTGLAGPGHTSATSSETLTLTFADSAPIVVEDGGRRGPSPGDVLYFRGSLGKQGGLIARADMLGARSVLFVTTIRIAGRGTIAAQGKLDFQGKEQGRLAILGGTGDFDGADGSIDVTSGKRERITFSVNLG